MATIYDENSIYFMLTTTDRDSFKYDGDYYYALRRFLCGWQESASEHQL